VCSNSTWKDQILTATFCEPFEVLAYERSLVKKEGRWTYSGGLLQSFPTLDNLRNFLLTTTTEVLSFFQQAQEAC